MKKKKEEMAKGKREKDKGDIKREGKEKGKVVLNDRDRLWQRFHGPWR